MSDTQRQLNHETLQGNQRIICRKPITWFRADLQPDRDLGSESELRNLGESLKKRQLSPLGALSDGTLLYGHRRLKAAELTGIDELDVQIFTVPLDAGQVKEIRITENIHRMDLSPFEKWQNCEAFRELHPQLLVKDLAERLNLEPSTVTKWLSPSKCIPSWQEALRAGKVGISDCYAASKGSEAQQHELLEKKLKGASRDVLEREIRQSRTISKATARRRVRISVLLPSEVEVTVCGNGLSLPELKEIFRSLEDAAKKAAKEGLDITTWQGLMRARAATETEPFHV